MKKSEILDRLVDQYANCINELGQCNDFLMARQILSKYHANDGVCNMASRLLSIEIGDTVDWVSNYCTSGFGMYWYKRPIVADTIGEMIDLCNKRKEILVNELLKQITKEKNSPSPEILHGIKIEEKCLNQYITDAQIVSKIKEMQNIAKEVMLLNPKSALTGSLMLIHRGLQPRRTPGDIDLYIEKDAKLFIPVGMVEIPVDESTGYDGYDEDACVQIRRFKYKGYKVDFFIPTQDISKQFVDTVLEVRCTTVEDTVRAKVTYIQTGRTETKEKHKLDIIHLLNQI